MYSLVSNFTMFILFSIVVNSTVAFVIMDIKVNRVSTDFTFTTLTFFLNSCGYANATEVFRAVDILCLVPL